MRALSSVAALSSLTPTDLIEPSSMNSFNTCMMSSILSSGLKRAIEKQSMPLSLPRISSDLVISSWMNDLSFAMGTGARLWMPPLRMMVTLSEYSGYCLYQYQEGQSLGDGRQWE